jgi:exodeoxyribonuclease-3
VFGLRIAGIYLPNGNPVPGPKFDYKLKWMERLRARMARIAAEEVPAIVLGDFNVIPEDKDVWAPAAMAADALMQPESRDAYARLLGDGWTDAIDTLNPRGGVWTFWDYQAGAWQRDHGFRIDHALLSPELADRMVNAGVDKDHRGREKASDHAPMWVELRG